MEPYNFQCKICTKQNGRYGTVTAQGVRKRKKWREESEKVEEKKSCK